MKKLFVLGAVLLIAGLGYLAARPEAVPEQQNAPTTRVTIPIEGMTCSACAAGVKSSLSRIGGVTHVEVDLAGRKAMVDYLETEVAPDDLIAAINDLGYKAGAPIHDAG